MAGQHHHGQLKNITREKEEFKEGRDSDAKKAKLMHEVLVSEGDLTAVRTHK